MKHFAIHSAVPSWWRRASRWLLALFWCTGLSLGVYTASSADSASISLMRLAVCSPVSIVGLLSVYLLPFLLTALAVFLFKSWFFLPISFLKAFAFGWCARAVTLSFGDSSWLIQLLFLFSDSSLLTVMCWFWIRHISGSGATVIRDAAICIVVFIVFGMLDYCCVSPFLAMLIN